MNSVIIYGASDDLIEIEGDVPGCDEYNAERALFMVNGVDGKAVRVAAEYVSPGVWAIQVSQLDEDYPMLPVNITGVGYSCRAHIDNVASVIRIHDD